MTRTLTLAALLTLTLAACGPSTGNPKPPAPTPVQDVQAPTLNISAPSTVASGGSFTLAVTGQDNVAVTRIEVQDAQGRVVGTSAASTYTLNLTAPTTGLDPVEATYTVRGFDAAGNMTSRTVTVLVVPASTPLPGDTVPPTVSAAAAPGGVTSGGSFTLRATAQDDVGVTRVDFLDPQGRLLGSDTAAPYELTVTAPANTGRDPLNLTYTVQAFDAAGNVGSAGVNVQVTGTQVQPPRDTTAPTVSVRLALPGGGSAGPSGSDVTVHADVSDDTGVTRVEFFDASGQSLGSTAPGQTPPYSVQTRLPVNTSSSPITAVFTVKAYDAAGNVGTGTASVQVAGVFLPGAGAPVGSGNGTVEGTVRVSPNAEEAEVLRLVNEVRTQGTLGGQDATAGSCVAGTFRPGVLRPLSYSGTLAHAAVQHSVYMSQEAVGGHEETITTSPHFYGATPQNRADRSRELFGGPYRAIGENVAGGHQSALEVMRAWMASPGHCQNLMNEQYSVMGVGYRLNAAWEGVGYRAWTQKFGL